jgi:hypothetical protein
MRESGRPSWRMVVRRWEQLIDGALWIRAAERLRIQAGGIIPGPLDIDPVPGPSTSSGARVTLAREWLAWWHSLVDAPGQDRDPTAGVPEPAYDTPDPLGLAGRPTLGAVVAQRWPEMQEWQTERTREGIARHLPPDMVDVRIVQDFERQANRPAKAFDVELLLLPVREDEIRKVFDHRYLVPERVYDSPRWAVWLRALVERIA